MYAAEHRRPGGSHGTSNGTQAEVLLRRRASAPAREEGAGGRHGRRGRAHVRRADRRDGGVLAVHEDHPSNAQAREPPKAVACPGSSSTPACTSATGSVGCTVRPWQRSSKPSSSVIQRWCSPSFAGEPAPRRPGGWWTPSSVSPWSSGSRQPEIGGTQGSSFRPSVMRRDGTGPSDGTSRTTP